jgi:hypothetical protein
MKKQNISLVTIFVLLIASFSTFAQSNLELQLTSMCSDNPASTRNWRVRNFTNEPITYVYQVVGTNQFGSLIAEPGDNFFSTITVPGPNHPNTTRLRWIYNGLDRQTVKASGGAQCQVAQSCYAVDYKDYFPKKRKDGTNLPEERSQPANALGAPQNNDTENFVSLGFGGEITLIFASNIKNGPGNDIKVWETTYGSPACDIYPERIKAYASQDGCNFRYLGEGCQDAEFDLSAAGLAWAKYIKLIDVTPIVFNGFDGGTDGYDVDAIECLNGSTNDNTPFAGMVGYAASVVDFTPNASALRKNGTPISNVTPNRRNPNNALGAPQNTDAVNFFSLGFGGFITLEFDYVVFDRDGYDLKITETSYRNPTCSNYPESALIEVSLDGVEYTSLGSICLDGMVDIAAAPAGGIRFVKITDNSPISSSRFPGSADGFDVDGVEDLNAGCQSQVAARFADNTNSPDEIDAVEVYPNPFNNLLNIRYTSSIENEELNVSVYNIAGGKVFSKNFQVNSNSELLETLNFEQYSNGVYIVQIVSKNINQTLKVTKN